MEHYYPRELLPNNHAPVSFLFPLIMKVAHLFIIIILISLIAQSIYAQNSSPIRRYYPAFGHNIDSTGKPTAIFTANGTVDQGKWTVDTVVCFLLQNHNRPDLNQAIDSIFTDAAHVVNSMGANIFLQKRYANLTDNIRNQAPIKNLIGFGEDLFNPADVNRLAQTITVRSPKLPIHGRYYSVATFKYIQLRTSQWNTGNAGSMEIVGDATRRIYDARSIMLHELMHFIGFGDHDAPRESVMCNGLRNVSSGWIHNFKPFNANLFTLDAIYARALYPQILPKRPDGSDRNLNNAPR